MSNLRRYYRENDIVFVTMVTYDRRPILQERANILSDALHDVMQKSESELVAWTILPDHWHCLLDLRNGNLSTLIQRIKMSFGARYRKKLSLSSGRLWQNRFWDHIIRNEADLNRHIDYIHYNPVKHGLVSSAFEWEWSSIHNEPYKSMYSENWGIVETVKFDGAFGE